MRSKIAQNRGSLTADNVTSFVFVPAHQLQRDLAIHPNGLLLCSLYHTKEGSSALGHSFLIRMTFTAKNLVNQICEYIYVCRIDLVTKLEEVLSFPIFKTRCLYHFHHYSSMRLFQQMEWDTIGKKAYTHHTHYSSLLPFPLDFYGLNESSSSFQINS